MIPFRAMMILWIVGSGSSAGGAEGELKADRFNPSALCGECHQEIFAMWRRSMHSAAFTDPIFQSSYLQAYRDTGGEAKKICLRCHAPVAALTGDFDMKEETSHEGIACDFCHSIVSVDLKRPERPFEVKFDGVKRGPLGDAESPVHDVAQSNLHQSAEFCAGCHEYVNEFGVPILSTYSEWKLSPQAAEGKNCQACHMPMIPGETVREDFAIQRGSINLHNISGGHSTEQVRKAATARILSVRREKPTVGVVSVEVANTGSGHSIPTGLPTRKLILEVILYADGQEVRRFERKYQKTLLDKQNRLITKDHRVLLDAWTLLDDNRLRAGERRVERLVARVPPDGKLEAEIHLRYFYEPEILSRQKISIEMATDNSH